MKRSTGHQEAGSSLLAVFWLLAILSFVVFTGLSSVVNQVDRQSVQNQAFRAEQLIERGLAIAAHSGVEPGSPLLLFEPEPTESLTVVLESEAARFNLNALLRREDRQQLQQLFAAWGLGLAESEGLIDRLLDWIDTDDLTRANGAEQEEYLEAGLAGLPFDRPFQSLDEVAQVLGMAELETLMPDWRDWLTLWSSTGKLDLNAAAPMLIQVACNCSLVSAESFVQTRNGSDGLPQTLDDVRFQTVDEALSFLGDTGLTPEQIAARLTVTDPVKRVAIVAMVGDYGARRDVVLSKNDRIQLHYWRDSMTR